MEDISLHLLDIIENSVQANARNIDMIIVIDKGKNRLSIKIVDNGEGMDEETLERAQQPFFTTKVARKKKIGLGIPLFKQNAEQCEGFFVMSSSPGKGTIIDTEFMLDHLDRMPLGNIADTFLTSILGHPDVDYRLEYSCLDGSTNKNFVFDTAEIRKELGEEIPLNYPDVIGFIREMLTEGILDVYVEKH